MRIWVLVTTLLIVGILTTEVFGKESKLEVDEITNESPNRENNKRETIKSESKKETSGKEGKHLQEQNKSKKNKGSVKNPEVGDSVGSKGSKKSRKSQQSDLATKPNNRQRKQEEQVEARNTIGQKVRHEKEKYKNKGINGQGRNNKKQNKRVKKDLKHVSEIEENIESDKKLENSNLDVVIENNRLRKKHKLKNVIEEVDLTIDNKSNSDRKKLIKRNNCKKCKGEKVVDESNVLDERVEEESGKITKKKKKRNVDSKVDKKSKKLSHDRKEIPAEDNEHEYKKGKEKSTSTSENEAVEHDENKNAEEESDCYKKGEDYEEEYIEKEIHDV